MQVTLGLCLWLLTSHVPCAATSIGQVIGGLSVSPTRLTPASTFWNPAVIGRIPGTQIETDITLTGAWLTFERTNPSEASSSTTASTTKFLPNPFLALSTSLGLDHWRFGYATYFPSGAAAEFAEDGPQRYDVIGGTLLPWHHQFTLAYEWGNWAFAVSGIYSLCTLSITRDIDFAPFISHILTSQAIPSEHPSLAARIQIERSYAHSFGGAFGVYYAPNLPWSFGVSFYSPMVYTFNTKLKLETPPFISSLGAGLKGLGIEDQIVSEIEAYSNLPMFLQAGLRFQPTGYWTGEYFGRYTFSSLTRSLSLKINRAPLIELEGKKMRGRPHKDAILIGSVQSFSLWRNWLLGMTASYAWNNVDDEHLSLSQVDFDSLLLAGFVQFQLNRSWAFGLEYSHSFMFDRHKQVQVGGTSALDSALIGSVDTAGTYRASIDRVGVQVRYGF